MNGPEIGASATVAEPGEAGQLLQPKGRAIAKHEK